MRRSCITIERQYGSGGREVGRILSHKLGIPFMTGSCCCWQRNGSASIPGS